MTRRTWAAVLSLTLLGSAAVAAQPDAPNKPKQVSKARQEFEAARALVSVSTLYFSGNVVGERNEPISGARVTINGISRLTDADGYYGIALEGTVGSRFVLDIQKAGRAPLSITYTDSNFDAVHVMRAATQAVINASTGGRVAAPNGTYVDIPANGLVDANGVPASGNVTLTLAHYGPATMPGDMTSVNAAGQETYLVTVGALYVSAEANGVSYDLAPTASASAFVSVPSEYGTTMPTCTQGPCTVTAWQLGTDGRWYERGTVTTTASGTFLTLQRPAPQGITAQAIPVTRGLGFWNADISFSDPACSVVEFVGMDQSCFGEPGPTGALPGITLNMKLPTPFGSSYSKTQSVTDASATFLVFYNLMASSLGPTPIYQEVGITFPPSAPVSMCAQRLVIDSSPRAPTGFPTYVRPTTGGGGGGNTRFEPGLPWGGTGQPAATKVGGTLRHPCRSKVVFKAQ